MTQVLIEEDRNYTAQEVADIMGIERATVCRLTHKHSIPYSFQIINGSKTSIYKPDAVRELATYSRPKKDTRRYTTRQIQEQANVTMKTIINVAQKLGIRYEVKYIEATRTAVFSGAEADRILSYVKENITDKRNAEPEIDPELLERHPLVKDMRCFKFNWWPDPIPKCFRDMEDDI